MRTTSKTHLYIDFAICLIIGFLYWRGTRALHVEINLILIIRGALIFVLTFLCVRVLRLVQYVATFDIDLTRYRDLDLNSIEIPFKYKFKMWKKYVRKPFQKTKLVAPFLPLVYVATAFRYIPSSIGKDTFVFLSIVYATILSLNLAKTISEFLGHLQFTYKLQVDVGYGKRKIICNMKVGLIIGILFIAILIYFFDMPKFHFFLYFLACSMLYTFSRTFIDLYNLFSHAIYLTLGHKFNQIPLTLRSGLYS